MTQPPVTLAEFRDHLNLNDGEDLEQDEERWRKVIAATDLVEDRCGPIRPRTVTSRCRPNGCSLLLPEFPVLSIESIVDFYAQPVLLTDINVDVDLEIGRIESPTYLGSRWYTANYTVGYDPIPQPLMEAVLVVAAQLWESQRGPKQTNRDTGTGGSDGAVPRGFAWPNRAKQLIQPFRVGNVA